MPFHNSYVIFVLFYFYFNLNPVDNPTLMSITNIIEIHVQKQINFALYDPNAISFETDIITI